MKATCFFVKSKSCISTSETSQLSSVVFFGGSILGEGSECSRVGAVGGSVFCMDLVQAGSRKKTLQSASAMGFVMVVYI